MDKTQAEILWTLTRAQREAAVSYARICDYYEDAVVRYENGTYDTNRAYSRLFDLDPPIYCALAFFGIIDDGMDEFETTEADLMPDIAELLNNY